MKNGGDITITVANAQDLAGNAISSPNYGTHTGGGIGTAPTVSTVAVQTGLTVDVTFSETMGNGVTTAGNYTVSGTGKGTLANNPTSVALVSGNKYRLTWTSGEMKNGGDITITVANAQDSAGNAIGLPNYGTHTGGGIGTAPTVSTVTSTHENSPPSYGVDEVIDVRVEFSEAVFVTGSPQLLLETGEPDRYAVYTSGDGTDTLVFEYVVEQGDASADLDYVDANALELNGGTIRDECGNNATLTLAEPGTPGSLGANKAIVVNTCVAPANPSANPSTICIGGSSTLSATPGSGGDQVWWYIGSCGGTPVGIDPGDQTVSPTATTTYYARTKNSATGCWSADCVNVEVTVNPLAVDPDSALADPAAICLGASSTLTATGGSGDSCKWYTGNCGETLAGTGTSIIVSPTSTTTYYVRWETASCGNSNCATTTVTLKAATSTTNPVGGVIYSGGELVMSVVGTGEGTLHYQWYKDGGEPVGTDSASYIATDAGSYTCTVTGECGSATSNAAVVTLLTSEGSIAVAKSLEHGAMVQLGNKDLYLKWTDFGYIEEPERFAGIRVEGAVTASQGKRVCLIGTIWKLEGAEPYIQVTEMTPNGSVNVKPLGANNRAVGMSLMDGIFATTWGRVIPGSITINSYVITDGSDDVGIRVVTQVAPTVNEGDFVVITGALGIDSVRVLYEYVSVSP